MHAIRSIDSSLSSSERPQAGAGQVVLAAMTLSTVFVFTSMYKSVLISVMTATTETIKIDSLDDLRKHPELEVNLVQGIEKAYPQVMTLPNKLRIWHQDQLKNNAEKVAKSLYEGK